MRPRLPCSLDDHGAEMWAGSLQRWHLGANQHQVPLLHPLDAHVPRWGSGQSRQGGENLQWASQVAGEGWVLAGGPLTFVRRHQQVQRLLGQIGPNQRDLLSQLSITLVLLDTP